MIEKITYLSSLSDKEFIQQFEQQTLSPEEFDHKGHLRIAWLYLSRDELMNAVDRVCGGIKAYAESLGAKDKFHHTLTEAIVRLMAVRMGSESEESFEDFLKVNADLVNNLPQVLAKHYSQSVLDSQPAKKEYVAPDLACFDCTTH